jgi:hypothetical protein
MSEGALRWLLLQILLWGALPAWILAGFGDWLCHRQACIERRSGAPEAVMHVVLYVLTAVPVLLGLFFDVTALVLVVMAACVVAHTGVAWIDTAFTQPRRHISAVEQAFHPWLELLPVFALIVVMALYADAWRAPEWVLRSRVPPLPAWIRIGVPLVLLPGLVLGLEELVRCSKVSAAERTPAARSVPFC